jgi:hypothetical protein
VRLHQGSVDPAYLPGYLDEFVFRFNARRSRSWGLVSYLTIDSTPWAEDRVEQPRETAGTRGSDKHTIGQARQAHP